MSDSMRGVVPPDVEAARGIVNGAVEYVFDFGATLSLEDAWNESEMDAALDAYAAAVRAQAVRDAVNALTDNNLYELWHNGARIGLEDLSPQCSPTDFRAALARALGGRPNE